MLIAALFLCVGNAYAANIEFDIDTGYAAGDETVTFNLNVTPDADVQVEGYQFDFKYDPNELVLSSFENSAITVLGPGYEIFDDYFKDDRQKGSLTWFGALVKYGHARKTLGAKTTTTLGIFTFELVEGAVLDGQSDFSMPATPFSDFYEGENKIPVNIGPALNHMTDVGGTSAVPVPAAVWLLGSGLVGLMGIRRKSA
jgi:hypothetical protein